MPGFHRLGPEAKRVVKFAIVGVCNTAVALVSYAILLELGVQYVIAGALGWTLGVLNGYTWHRIWTFDRAEHEMSLLVRYTAVGVLGLSLNTGLLALLISVFGIGELPAEFLALPIVVLTTFLVNRYWVFRTHVEETATRPPSTTLGRSAPVSATEYDPAFYDLIREGTKRSAEAVVPMLVEEVGQVDSVVDVGGGEGWWGKTFEEVCGATPTCIDGDYVDRPVVSFIPHDLKRSLLDVVEPGFADLALCLEVAEHLPPSCAERLVEDLCGLADTVVFSAAIPGQGGVGHLNERWPSYWADLFQTRGYGCDDSIRWRIWNDGRVKPWYRQNLLIFQRGRIGKLPAGVVHPIVFEHWMALASSFYSDDPELTKRL